MISVDFDRNYYVYLDALLQEQPELVKEIETCIRRFRKNPRDTRLANHHLIKHMVGRWAFSVMNDIRIIYLWTGKHTVRFLSIGRHVDVYKK